MIYHPSQAEGEEADMEYDPRGQYGHMSGGGGQQQPGPGPGGPPDPYVAAILEKVDRQRPPLTFGQVFWACFLALLAWGVLAYLMIAQLIEEAENGF